MEVFKLQSMVLNKLMNSGKKHVYSNTVCMPSLSRGLGRLDVVSAVAKENDIQVVYKCKERSVMATPM